MDAGTTALVVAIVGVIGTLTAPAISQRLAMKARAQELEAERRRRAEDRNTAQWVAELAERRATYVELNAAIRAFRRSVRDHLLEQSSGTRSELEQARQALDRRCAEAQLLASDAAIEGLARLSFILFQLYDDVVGVDRDIAPNDPEQARARLFAHLSENVALEAAAFRKVIRAELGTSGAGI